MGMAIGLNGNVFADAAIVAVGRAYRNRRCPLGMAGRGARTSAGNMSNHAGQPEDAKREDRERESQHPADLLASRPGEWPGFDRPFDDVKEHGGQENAEQGYAK